MSSASIATVVKMMEALPEEARSRVVEHLQEYLEDLQDEFQWDETFGKTRGGLKEAARRAKREMAAGQGRPLDPEKL